MSLGGGAVGGHPIGAGPRCHDGGPALDRVGAQRGLSRRCHPGGLERPGRHGPTGLAPGVAAPAPPGPPGGPPGVARIVLADGGVSARWRCRRLTRRGWHPFWRLNTGGPFRPQGQGRGVPLKTWVPEPGTTGQGTGLAGTGRQRQRHCPLLAGWEAGDTDPWLLLTDVPPEASPACWYGLRAWSAPGVTMTTRAGWQWQRTPRTTPDRAVRLWLAVAVATLGLLRVGGEADETIPASTVPAVTALAPTSSRTRRATRLRLVRVCRRGWHRSLGALLDHAPLPLGRFVPDPWPAVPVPEEATPSLLEVGLPQAA